MRSRNRAVQGAVLSAILLQAAACSLSLDGTDAPAERGAPNGASTVATNDGTSLDATVDVLPMGDASTVDATGVDAAPDVSPDAALVVDASGPCHQTATSCGATGACVSCANAPQGHACVVVGATASCGCGGPGDHANCSPLTACRDQQCVTSCDGQHPCNGGCCSAATDGQCVAACQPGQMCITNACQ